jgi:uncharacterized protein (TIGR02996 family)
MIEERSLLEAILAAPDDVALRLACTDWLEERGKDPEPLRNDDGFWLIVGPLAGKPPLAALQWRSRRWPPLWPPLTVGRVVMPRCPGADKTHSSERFWKVGRWLCLPCSASVVGWRRDT